MQICLLFQWIIDIYPELSGTPFILYHSNSYKQKNMTDLSVLSAIGEEQIMEFNIKMMIDHNKLKIPIIHKNI